MMMEHIEKPSVKENYDILCPYVEANFVLIKGYWYSANIVISQQKNGKSINVVKWSS